jgi:two-component system, sensor histidine kinase and response regulator
MALSEERDLMKVVVIEDSKTQAHRLRRLLEGEGFSVQVAEDGEAGLRLCAGASLPDIVVSDVLMPGIDGYEVCRRLKSTPATSQVPVLLLTSLADPQDVVRALAAGADNFVTKPYDAARLLARIRLTIANHTRAADECVVDVQGSSFRVDAPPERILRLLVSCLEDATERNAELEASRAALALANQQREVLITAERAARQAREELLAIVAHDLRTPLGVVALSSNALQEAVPAGPAGDEVRALAGLAERAAAQMGLLIRDLLDVSSIEAGRLRFEFHDHDPVVLLDEAANLLAPLAAQKEISVEKRVAAAVGLVRCDRDRIQQVLSNLIGNAIKFTPERGKISLSAEGTSDEVTFIVADNGPGIAAEAIPRIFDRHWTGRGKAGADTGLGLYIAKGIVEAHEGRIAVAIARGGGTEFSFMLPRSGPARPSWVSAPPDAAGHAPNVAR